MLYSAYIAEGEGDGGGHSKFCFYLQRSPLTLFYLNLPTSVYGYKRIVKYIIIKACLNCYRTLKNIFEFV